MHLHLRVECSKCHKVIRQCRCISKDKPVKYELCSQCGPSATTQKIVGPITLHTLKPDK